MKRRTKKPRPFKKDPELSDLQGWKPWIDKQGKRLPIDILKIIARRWNEETWNAYLDSFEEPAHEKYVSEQMWIDITERLTESVFVNVAEPAPFEIDQEVDSNVQILPNFHRQVIRMTYWQNMSVRRIAAALGLTKSVVQRMVKDAEQTLRALIKQPLGHFALSEGTKQPNRERKNDQDISA